MAVRKDGAILNEDLVGERVAADEDVWSETE